jgi:serine/threonine-protein kinase
MVEDRMSNATSAPEPGQILAGKYLVEEVLGVGGMGVVVAARHLQLDQRVAIKYLLPAALLNPEVVARFAREARAAAKIRGEHVARVIDVGQFDDGAPFMVLEYLEGEDLAKHLEEKGPLAIEDAMRWILETCEALAEAHAAKIVHRDLKPSNLFLSKQPDRSVIVKVLDFGISKTGDAPSASLTKTSALMGTAFYMSPEQLINPKGVDHRSDLWSLGVILYELLSGQPPFLGETVPEIIGAILQNEPVRLRTLRPDVSLDLELVIAKCMQTKPADRYGSVAALAAALGPFARVADRASIDITARVLGEFPAANAVPDASPATLLVPASRLGGPASSVASSASSAPSDSRDASPPGGRAPASTATPPRPAAAAITTHGVSTSASAVAPGPKRSALTAIATIAVLAVAVGSTVVSIKLARSKNDVPSATASGLVSGITSAEPALPPASPPAATLANAPAAASASSAPLASATPAVPAVPASSPAAHAVSPPGALHARSNGATAPVKSAAPPAAIGAATATAAPASSSSKNPLQMGIK